MTSIAYAMGGNPGGAAGGAESGWGFILPMIVIFVIFFTIKHSMGSEPMFCACVST